MRNKREMLYEAYWAIKPSRSKSKKNRKLCRAWETAGKRNIKKIRAARNKNIRANKYESSVHEGKGGRLQRLRE